MLDISVVIMVAIIRSATLDPRPAMIGARPGRPGKFRFGVLNGPWPFGFVGGTPVLHRGRRRPPRRVLPRVDELLNGPLNGPLPPCRPLAAHGPLKVLKNDGWPLRGRFRGRVLHRGRRMARLSVLLVGGAGIGLHVLHLGVGWHRLAGVLRAVPPTIACLLVVEVQLGALLVAPFVALLVVLMAGRVAAGRLFVPGIVTGLAMEARVLLVMPLSGARGVARRALLRGRVTPRLSPLLVTAVFHLLCGT